MPDIDIDFADRSKILEMMQHIKASRYDNDKLVDHNTGIYFQAIPHDPFSLSSTLDYRQAEERGYFKIDFLNASVYQGIKNEKHLLELQQKEPLWDLLEQDDFTNLLFHVNGHGSVLRQMKPKSISQLAAVLAMIRPAKRYLIGKPWDEVMDQVWQKPENDEYYFKKAHAVAYAHAIVIQMNYICDQISYEYS